jgi:hypothetical protein
MEAIEFCIKYRRILLLDTFNATYQINWNQFVDFKHPCIITDQDEIRRICSQPHTVAPSFFANKLLDIVDGRIKFTFNTELNCYAYNNIHLRGFHQDHAERMLVYSIHGGGDGYNLFKQLTIKPELQRKCVARWWQLPKPYIAVQVRHTDYQCDYQCLYKDHKALLHRYKCVYIATDNRNVLKWFHAKGLPVANFTTFGPEVKTVNLHENELVDAGTRFTDMIADVFIVSMADKLVSNSAGGFIRFLRDCHMNKEKVALQFKS